MSVGDRIVNFEYINVDSEYDCTQGLIEFVNL